MEGKGYAVNSKSIEHYDAMMRQKGIYRCYYRYPNGRLVYSYERRQAPPLGTVTVLDESGEGVRIERL